MEDISGYFYIYPTYVDLKKRMYGLGFICCSEKDNAMKDLLKKDYFDYIDFEDPCVFVFITDRFNFIEVIRENPCIPFIVKDSRIIYLLGKEISLKGEYEIESEEKMDLIPRFVDHSFTLNPLKQLIISENRLEQEEKICLLLVCDRKLLKLLESKKCRETRINLRKDIEGKMKRFYDDSLGLFKRKSRESKLKLLFHYERTLRKILGILPQNPRGPVSSFKYFIEDLEKEKDFKRSIAYFQPIWNIKKIKIDFIIETNSKISKTDKKLENYFNKKRNHLEDYVIRLIGEYEPMYDKQFQRLRHEMIVDFHWDSPDIFNLGEFFHHLVECFEEGVKRVDIASFEKFKSKTPRELWIKEIVLTIETPDIFADMIIKSLTKHYLQVVRFDKQKLLDKTAIELTLTYLEPEDYLGTGEGIFNLVHEKPVDTFSRIAVDWALDRDFKQSYLFIQKAIYALIADFMSLIQRDNGVKKNAVNIISGYIFPSVGKSSEKDTTFETKKVTIGESEYLITLMKNAEEMKKNVSIKKVLYFPDEKRQAEIQYAIKGLLLSMSRKKILREKATMIAQTLYEEAGVTFESKSLKYTHYSVLESQFDIAEALVKSLQWQRKIGFFEKGIFIRERARRFKTKNHWEYYQEVRKGNDFIRKSTIPLVRDTSTFEDDLARLYTFMMRDLQRKFPEETRNWIWGTEY